MIVLRSVGDVVDGADGLRPGHFYDLPSSVACCLIQQHAAFEVPGSDDVRHFKTGSADRHAANAASADDKPTRSED